jgi:prepilin-type processing-associated H-X9-DG protein
MREIAKEQKLKWLIVVICVLGFAAVVRWGWYPADARARRSSRRAECKNKLREIGLALDMYSAGHKGKFPDGETAADVFSQLVEGEYLSEEVGRYGTPVYVCPGAKEDIKAWKRSRQLTEETCSYEWVAGIDADSPPKFVLAFDKTADHHRPGEMRMILFVDGHVELMLEENFQEYMSWQREMIRGMKEGGEYVNFYEWRDKRDEKRQEEDRKLMEQEGLWFDE